jgi:hypothetical protein
VYQCCAAARRLRRELSLLPARHRERPLAPLYNLQDDNARKVTSSLTKAQVQNHYVPSQDDIATHLGINGDTLRKHYRKELNEGVFKAHMKVRGAIPMFVCLPGLTVALDAT